VRDEKKRIQIGGAGDLSKEEGDIKVPRQFTKGAEMLETSSARGEGRKKGVGIDKFSGQRNQKCSHKRGSGHIEETSGIALSWKKRPLERRLRETAVPGWRGFGTRI